MRYAKSFRVLLSGLCALALAGNYLLQPTRAGAAAADSGQLSLANQVSINGTTAIPGQTVFSGTSIRVAKQGGAVLNLGRMGRIEVGGDSDFGFRMANNVVGGELNFGGVMLNVPAGVKIELSAAKGVITSDGASPASFLVGMKNGVVNIIPTLGSVEVEAGGKSEKVGVGELLKLTSDSTGGEHFLRGPAAECGERGSLCGCSTPLPRATAASNAGKGAAAAPGAFLLPVLLLTVAGGTAAAVAGLIDGGNNGLTCVGADCRPISPTRP